MKTDITNTYLTTLINSTINSIEGSYPQWASGTRYLEGARVRAETRLYIAVSTGISSTVLPTHSSGRALDGTVQWLYVMTIQPPQALGANIYLGIGRRNEWTDEPEPDDVGTNTHALALEDLVAAVKLTRRDLALGAVRNEWETGGVYDQWPSTMSYVNVGTAVYRCISNNLGAESTVVPAGNSLTLFENVDGYVWKYLGDISNNLDSQFGTDTVFAVNPLYANDASNRWLVQSVAKPGEVSGYTVLQQSGTLVDPTVRHVSSTGTGAVGRVDLNGAGSITRIVPTAFGTGYKVKDRAVVQESDAPGTGAVVSANLVGGEIDSIDVDVQGDDYTDGAVVFIDGDGTGAQATATVTSGHVTSVEITNPGTGYTTANAQVVAGGSAALVGVVLSPQGGHGKDILKEIPINHMLVHRRFSALDSGYIPNGEFRQLTLLTGVTATGTSDILVGPAHPTPGSLSVAGLSNARVLYVSNLATVEHSDAQDEEIKLALKIE